MSTNARIYLDFNATAPLVPAARDAIAAALAIAGNPSSIHTEGRTARDLVERARNHVAALLGRPREQVVLTSGGTEANALGVLALAGVVEKRGGPRVVVTTEIEHPSLRGAVAALRARGWEVRTTAHVEGAGLLAVGLVNHELGTMAEASLFHAARAAGLLVHVDAVQAAGKIALAGIDADAIAISAHKIGGPQGAGALAITSDEGMPLVDGGHQERGRRPGTENTLGIVGFGAAANALVASGPADTQPTETQRINRDDLRSDGVPLRRSSAEISNSTSRPITVASWRPVAALGDHLEHGLRAMGARIHGDDRPRVGGTVNAAFGGALGESIVIALDLAGIAASTGAACTSGSVQPSPVLLALGYQPEHAREAVRFSLGRPTTRAEIDRVLAALPDIVERARRH
jgi:cysteine desulfurase